MEKKLKKVISNPYVQLFLIILSVTGINGLVILQNVGDVRLVVEISLFVMVFVLIFYVWRLRKQIKRKPKEAILERIGPTFLLNGASKLFTVVDKTIFFGPIEDSNLKIDKVSCDYKLSFTETGNMLVKRRYQGVNMDNQPALYVSTFAGGDHSITDETFKKKLKAYDSKGNELSTQLIKGWTSGTVKPFKIFFATPIKEGKPFDVTVEYYWPACISRNPDGLLFWNTYFRKGVDELNINIESPVKFKNCRIEKLFIKDGEIEMKRDNPQPFLNPELSLSNGPYFYEAKISKPVSN